MPGRTNLFFFLSLRFPIALSSDALLSPLHGERGNERGRNERTERENTFEAANPTRCGKFDVLHARQIDVRQRAALVLPPNAFCSNTDRVITASYVEPENIIALSFVEIIRRIVVVYLVPQRIGDLKLRGLRAAGDDAVRSRK